MKNGNKNLWGERLWSWKQVNSETNCRYLTGQLKYVSVAAAWLTNRNIRVFSAQPPQNLQNGSYGILKSSKTFLSFPLVLRKNRYTGDLPKFSPEIIKARNLHGCFKLKLKLCMLLLSKWRAVRKALNTTRIDNVASSQYCKAIK